MRKLRNIVNGVLWTGIGLYIIVIVLLHLPPVQSFIGTNISDSLSRKLGTKVQVGKVDLGFLNRIIIDDLLIIDQQQKEMLKATRLSAKFDYLPLLLQGKINISSVQLFGLKAHLYKRNASSKPNFQFILDSLASKDTTSQTPLDLKINSLIIRRGDIQYHRQDIPQLKSHFSPHHIHVQNISAHVIINALKDDSVNINMKNLALDETSGIHLKSLSFKLIANHKEAVLSSFKLTLPGTSLDLGEFRANYKFENNKLLMPTIDFQGSINPSSITLYDLSAFVPAFKNSKKSLSIQSSFTGTSTTIRVNQLKISSPQSNVELLADGSLSNWQSKPRWAVNVHKLQMSAEGIQFIADNFGSQLNIPPHVTRLGNIFYRGELGGYDKDIALKGIINTEAGNANIALGKHLDNFSGRIETKGLSLNKILANDKFGNISTHINIDGKIPGNNNINFKAKGYISQFEYNQYAYQNITIDGSFNNGSFDGLFAIKDPNADMNLKGKFNFSSHNPYAHLTAEVNHLNPSELRLSDKWPNTQFTFKVLANITGKNINTANGSIEVSDFLMASEKKNYYLKSLSVNAYNKDNIHQLDIDSDFGHVNLSGKYDYNTLAQSITNLIGNKLPTLPGLPKTTKEQTNDFVIDATIERSDWLQDVFNIPLQLNGPIKLSGTMSDMEHSLNMTLDMADFSYAGKKFEKGYLKVTTPNDTIKLSAHVRRVSDDGRKFHWDVQAEANDNKLSSSITFNNMRKQPLKGQINTEADFYKDETGNSTAHVKFKSSTISIGDTVWHVLPSEVTYSKNNVNINNFTITHHNQHIEINGKATKSLQDSITVDLKDVDVNYILNLINFHPVEFSGLASGTAILKAPFNKPEAYGNIFVKNFRFEGGQMGDLTASVFLNNKSEQIDINAIAHDDADITTSINGYVSPKRNYIDLNIGANNTRLEFIESFCGSFMRDVKAQAQGYVRLFGPLNKINLEGQLVANGDLSISSLNTTYTLRNDIIKLVPDHIIFEGDTIYDKTGNIGIVQGSINHDHLTNLSYNINIDTKNLLAYDFKTLGNNSFCGTVRATGKCSIRGKSGEVNIDIEGTPEKNSLFVYDVASPDAVNNNQFIRWGKEAMLMGNDSLAVDSIRRKRPDAGEDFDIPTDIHLNFLINCTPDATLKLLMDRQSGDYITLNGTGVIRASYYNKGSFDMFGNYTVDHGVYKLTIQNVIKKDFEFERGGTIAFGGDPYNAQLNLKAIYTANGVSLSDLNLGQSFSSNSIKVNCLMNITGTPEAPKVGFDLDMPTVNSNVKQMIYSLINGEEEMNQQVLYLLAVGRFYTQGSNNSDISGSSSSQSQTSLAMQSILSGTISQQLNSVLSNVINNTNWNFGANISTGDEGWNNAEYEGLLSGRLLNNRLLINGQFGYRDNANATTSFIGDFDVRYLLFPNGNLAIRMYNQTNDKYFTKNSMTTQGLGLIMKKDFNGWKDLFGRNRKKEKSKEQKKQKEQKK